MLLICFASDSMIKQVMVVVMIMIAVIVTTVSKIITIVWRSKFVLDIMNIK